MKKSYGRLLSLRWIVNAELCLVCLTTVTAFAEEPAEPELTVEEILDKIDTLYRSDTAYAEMVMEIVTPHWERTLELRVWSEGLAKTFIRVLAPKKERGVATLRIGDEMWNYLPNTNKVIKIPPSMMMSSWMGSDFTNDDLVKEYTFRKDYQFKLTDFAAGVEDRIYIECIPREGRPIIWGKVVIAVRKSDYLPAWEKYYDEKGRVVRELTFAEIREMAGRRVPTVMTMIPQHEGGSRTTLRYRELEFDTELPSGVFSLRQLRSPIQ